MISKERSMLLLSVIFTWFAVLAPSMAETEAERRVAALEYKLTRHEKKLEDVEKELYAMGRTREQTGACPFGFEEYKDSCYYFNLGTVQWDSAVALCSTESPGAYLVEINSLDENTYIKGKAANLGGNHWIGLTDRYNEGRFMWWHSGHVIEGGNFKDWGPTEPNGGISENCVTLDQNQSYKWADFPCSRNFHFICEKAARK